MTDEIVTITTFVSLPEAEACKLRLESEGLMVFLADSETISTDWSLSNAIGSIKVQVPGSQAQIAATLLEQIRQQREGRSKCPDQDFCLACGIEMPEEASQCQACGWSYAKVDEEDDDANEVGDDD